MGWNRLVDRGPWPALALAALLPLNAAWARGTGFCPGPKAAAGAEEAFEDGTPALAGARPQQLGRPATDIHGIDASGAPMDLARFKGKVILLDVSTMWCVFCMQDAAPLQYLYQTYGPKGLAVITCLTEDVNGAAVTQAGLRQWSATNHLTQPVMNDASGTHDGVAERVYVQVTGGFPTLVIIDKEFNVQFIQGGLDLAAVTAKIEALLAQ